MRPNAFGSVAVVLVALLLSLSVLIHSALASYGGFVRENDPTIASSVLVYFQGLDASTYDAGFTAFTSKISEGALSIDWTYTTAGSALVPGDSYAILQQFEAAAANTYLHVELASTCPGTITAADAPCFVPATTTLVIAVLTGADFVSQARVTYPLPPGLIDAGGTSDAPRATSVVVVPLSSAPFDDDMTVVIGFNSANQPMNEHTVATPMPIQAGYYTKDGTTAITALIVYVASANFESATASFNGVTVSSVGGSLDHQESCQIFLRAKQDDPFWPLSSGSQSATVSKADGPFAIVCPRTTYNVGSSSMHEFAARLIFTHTDTVTNKVLYRMILTSSITDLDSVPAIAMDDTEPLVMIVTIALDPPPTLDQVLARVRLARGLVGESLQGLLAVTNSNGKPVFALQYPGADQWRALPVSAETLKKGLDSVALPMAKTTYAVSPLAKQGQWFCKDEYTGSYHRCDAAKCSQNLDHQCVEDGSGGVVSPTRCLLRPEVTAVITGCPIVSKFTFGLADTVGTLQIQHNSTDPGVALTLTAAFSSNFVFGSVGDVRYGSDSSNPSNPRLTCTLVPAVNGIECAVDATTIATGTSVFFHFAQVLPGFPDSITAKFDLLDAERESVAERATTEFPSPTFSNFIIEGDLPSQSVAQLRELKGATSPTSYLSIVLTKSGPFKSSGGTTYNSLDITLPKQIPAASVTRCIVFLQRPAPATDWLFSRSRYTASDEIERSGVRTVRVRVFGDSLSIATESRFFVECEVNGVPLVNSGDVVGVSLVNTATSAAYAFKTASVNGVSLNLDLDGSVGERVFGIEYTQSSEFASPEAEAAALAVFRGPANNGIKNATFYSASGTKRGVAFQTELPLDNFFDFFVTTAPFAVAAASVASSVTFGSILSGTYKPGQIYCKSSSGKTEPCTITPAGCGTAYQGSYTCAKLDGKPAQPMACAFLTPVEPMPMYDACDPKITKVTPMWADDKFAFEFELDPTQFIKGIDVSFKLFFADAANTNPFNFTAPTCSDGVTCSWTGSELVVSLPKLRASGSFFIDAVPRRYSKRYRVDFDALDSLSGVSLLADDTIFYNFEDVLVETTEAELQTYFSPTSETEGSLIVLLGVPGSVVPIATFDSDPIRAAELSLPGDWSLESATCVAVALVQTDTTWAFSATPMTTTRVGNTFTFTTSTISAFASRSFRLECSGVTAVAVGGGSVTLNVIGADDAYLVKKTNDNGLTVSPTDFAHGFDPLFIAFTLNMGTTEFDDAKSAAVRAAVLGSRTDVDYHVKKAGADATFTLGLTGANRVFSTFITTAMLNGVVEEINNFIPGAGFSATGAFTTGNIGSYMCTDDVGEYVTCTAVNDCAGAYQSEPECYDKRGVDTAHSCVFATSPSDFLPVTSGCGTLWCISGNSPIACNDPSLCIAGCKSAVPISINVAADEHLVDGPFKQACFVNGVLASMDLCPTGLVIPQTYAGTCNATSTCALHCAGLDGKLKSCSSDRSWAACDATCGTGKQARITKCSGETSLKIGDTIDAVPDSFCNAVTPAFDVERPCDGRGCTSYAWKCMVAGSPVDCDDSAGYSGCSGKCGAATETRAVVCTSVMSDGTFAGLETNESFCTARALKPASSRICTSTDCTGAVWKCYQRGGNPFSPVTCGDGGAVSCPVDKCHAAVSIARNVGCYDQETNARAAASKCNAAAKPDTTIVCEADTSGCVVDFTGAKCDTVTDHTNAGRTCIPSAGTPSGVFRVGKCVDTTGTVVTGVCSEAQVRKQCVLPVCAGAEMLTYAWATDKSSSLCQDGCKSFAPVAVTCVASGVGDPTEVDDSFCAAADKPLPYEACEPGLCASGSTCGADTPVFVGATKYSGIFATCVCPAGFYGPLCDQTAELSITFDRATSTASWTFGSAGAANAAYFLTFSVSLDDAPRSVSDGPLPVPDTGAMRLTYAAETADLVIVPANMNCDTDAGCSYKLDVSGVRHGFHMLNANFIGATAPSGGSTILEQIDCDGGSCGAHGSCDYETYACKCDEGYSGAQCEVAPCATAGCNVLASSCDFASGDSDVAQCICDSADFTGAKCDALDGGCPQTQSCANGAKRVVFSDHSGAATCGVCQCSGNWAGELCDTCALQCQNEGTVDAASGCSKCTCTKAGVHGDTCELHHSVLLINVAQSAATEWFFTPSESASEFAAALIAWAKTFVRSFAALSGNPAIPARLTNVAPVADEAGTKYMRVTIHYGSYTPGSSAQFETYAAIETLKARAQVDRSAVGAPRSHVSELPALAPLYMARGMGASDPSCVDGADADVTCPKSSLQGALFSEGDEPSSGSDSLTTKEKIAVGVCVGVGGALLIALILFILYKCGALADYSEKVKTAQPAEGGVEMTAATYDV